MKRRSFNKMAVAAIAGLMGAKDLCAAAVPAISDARIHCANALYRLDRFIRDEFPKCLLTAMENESPLLEAILKGNDGADGRGFKVQHRFHVG